MKANANAATRLGQERLPESLEAEGPNPEPSIRGGSNGSSLLTRIGIRAALQPKRGENCILGGHYALIIPEPNKVGYVRSELHLVTGQGVNKRRPRPR